MRSAIRHGVRSWRRWALLGGALLSQSCETLWGPFGRDNPENCVASPGCLADEVCDPASQVCVSALRLDGISPARAPGRGGATLTLRGQRFVAGATVFVDDQPASGVTVVSPEELRFTLPASTRGLWQVPVAVQNPSQHRSERRDLFAYYADTLSFESRAIAVAGVPIGVASGDWNSDQKLDLALITVPTSGVQVLLGDGSGGFAANTSVAVGSAANKTEHIRSFDGNRDGKADLLVTAGGTLTLLFGDGQGGFPTRRLLYTASGSNHLSALAVGDYDADGRADIVFTDSASDDSAGSVMLLLNGGDDSFATPSLVDSGKPAGTLAIADFTGDGRGDVLVAIEGLRLSLWRNDGGSARTQLDLAIAPCPVSKLAVGDLNADDRPDLLLHCNTTLRPLINQGDGQFSARPDLPTVNVPNPSLLLSDLNGDGQMDAVVGTTSQLVGLLGDGAGGFAAEQEIATYSPATLGTGLVLYPADWDRDGKTDVLSLAKSASPPCRLLLNRSR